MNKPLSDEWIAQYRHNLDHALDAPTRGDDLALLHEVERLRAEVAAMRPIVEAVAEIDNSDNSACYVTCDLTLYDSEAPNEGIRHNAPCVIVQACSYIIEHPNP